MIGRIELLDDLGAEFARVAAEAERTSRKPPAPYRGLFRSGLRVRTLAIALGLAVVLVSAAYAVPATRTAVDGVAASFAGWVSGDNDDAPGRALEPGDDVPSWFNAKGEARLIAKTDGVGLYVRRSDSDQGPYLEFGLGEGMIMGATLVSWRQRLDRHSVVVLGSALVGPRDVLDDQGRSPLLGVTARNVKQVELRYAEGPPLVGDASDGGFVLLVDAWRPPRELIAYNGAGRVLERADVSNLDLRYRCEKEPAACPSD